MAVKAKKVKEESKAPTENFEGVIASMNAVVESVEKLSGLIQENLEKMSHPLVMASGVEGAVAGATLSPAFTAPKLRTDKTGLPIPTEYIQIMEEVLNKKFDIQVEYMPDTSSFELAILVPKEYSNASQPHWDTFHEDRRSKVIENALGVTGVREWITQIYENFGNETKSRITLDRQTTL